MMKKNCILLLMLQKCMIENVIVWKRASEGTVSCSNATNEVCVCVCVNIFDSNFMSSYLIRNSCLHLEERVLINQNHMITSAAQTVLRLNTPTRVTDLSANHTTAVWAPAYYGMFSLQILIRQLWQRHGKNASVGVCTKQQKNQMSFQATFLKILKGTEPRRTWN